jgi:hypothetical protein
MGNPDDHDRKIKGDRICLYKERRVSIDSKSLQRNTVVQVGIGKVQIDGSDLLSNGEIVESTCITPTQFDIVALFSFRLETSMAVRTSVTFSFP